MRNRNKIISLLTASTLALSLVFNNVTRLLTVNAASTKASVNEIDDGAILHAWNWSFDTIKSNIKRCYMESLKTKINYEGKRIERNVESY